jgi:hypothetical protein
MFKTPAQLEAVEEINAKNWALWHKRKKLITWPAMALTAAFVLSFTYYTGEHAGVQICTAPAVRR